MMRSEELQQLCLPIDGSTVYYRPILCRRYNKSVHEDIWIIGANPATPITVNDISFGNYVEVLSNYFEFNELYEYVRKHQDKNKKSPTRKYMQEFEEWILSRTSVNVIETNVNAFPTSRYRNLHSSDTPKTAQRGYEIFAELLLRFQPQMLILHGQDAQKALRKLVKNHSELSIMKALYFDHIGGSHDVLVMKYPDGRRATIVQTPHFSKYRHYPGEFDNIRRCIQNVLNRPPTSIHSWSAILAMPARHQRLRFSFSIREKAMRRLTYGFYPIDMDEKWFVYTEGSTTYFHRSWTEHCIFQIRFEHVDLEYRAVEILVNRDREQISIEDESEIILILQQALKGMFGIYI